MLLSHRAQFGYIRMQEFDMKWNNGNKVNCVCGGGGGRGRLGGGMCLCVRTCVGE